MGGTSEPGTPGPADVVFTQRYPDGTTEQVWFQRTDAVGSVAALLREAGYAFGLQLSADKAQVTIAVDYAGAPVVSVAVANTAPAMASGVDMVVATAAASARQAGRL